MARRGARCGQVDCPSGDQYGHWSHMDCGDIRAKVPHQNHIWDSDVVIYGPYWCEGFGTQAPPAEPSRQQFSASPFSIPDGGTPIFWTPEDVREWLDNDDGEVWERTVSYTQWKRVARDEP